VAQDLAGNSLAQNYSVTFTTSREITQTLLPYAALTGQVRSDGIVNLGGPCLGDTLNGYTFRGFVWFDMSVVATGIPTGGWLQAQLQMTQNYVIGAPFSNLGALTADSLGFNQLNLTA
jgi:hypothetical protein